MKRILPLFLAAAAALVNAGCDDFGYAAIQTAHPPLGHRKVETNRTAFTYSKSNTIEIVAERQWVLAGGEAVPDFEYLYISVPQQKGAYHVGDPNVKVRRLVYP